MKHDEAWQQKELQKHLPEYLSEFSWPHTQLAASNFAENYAEHMAVPLLERIEKLKKALCEERQMRIEELTIVNQCYVDKTDEYFDIPEAMQVAEDFVVAYNDRIDNQ